MHKVRLMHVNDGDELCLGRKEGGGEMDGAETPMHPQVYTHPEV